MYYLTYLLLQISTRANAKELRLVDVCFESNY